MTKSLGKCARLFVRGFLVPQTPTKLIANFVATKFAVGVVAECVVTPCKRDLPKA
jgi:hypothetical protein